MGLVNVQEIGNGLIAHFDDNSVVTLTRVGGLWIAQSPGVAQGAGGEGYTDGGTASNTPGSVTAPVDDYPWPSAPENDFSPLGYSYRDCVDFVAWRINRDDGVTHSPWKYVWGNMRITNGNAIGWRPDWITHGWGVDLPAAAGRIGWYGSKVGQYGHVNYVQSVATDGTIHVEEYNWGSTQKYGQRDIAPGSPYYPDSFLAIPA